MMYTSILFASLLSVAGSTGAYAASIPLSGRAISGLNISQSCTVALGTVATGPLSQCLNFPGLIAVNPPKDQSLVDPLDSYLQSVCKAPACDATQFPQATSTITTGCSSDLQSLGLTADQLTSLSSNIGQGLQQYYSVGREVACLEDTSNSNKLCVTTTLKAIESAIGMPLSVNNILQNSLSLPTILAQKGFTKDTICTPCIQGAWSLLKPVLPQDAVGSLEAQITNLCGADFENSKPPASIVSQASTTGPSKSSAASLSIFPLSTISIVGAVGIAFSLFL